MSNTKSCDNCFLKSYFTFFILISNCELLNRKFNDLCYEVFFSLSQCGKMVFEAAILYSDVFTTHFFNNLNEYIVKAQVNKNKNALSKIIAIPLCFFKELWPDQISPHCYELSYCEHSKSWLVRKNYQNV